MNKKYNFLKNFVLPALYAGGGLAVLICTTILWASLGAQLNSQNADQLVNSYLFESPDTFKEAFVPYQHSFLFKWPLFLFAKILGFTNLAFLLVTLMSVLLTVIALAYLIYRIENRMLVFGTLCLALASTLILVPAQPYDGALLPVNMAMITTRNLEYVLYILSIVLILRGTYKKSSFWFGVVLLSILFASDRLFVSISLGGALLATVCYWVMHARPMMRIAIRWLLATVAAIVVATIILWVLQLFTDISHTGISPYGFITDFKELARGVIYVFVALSVNFGVLPASDPRILADIMGQVWRSAGSIYIASYIVNFLIFIAAIWAMAVVFWRSFKVKIDPKTYALPVILVWTLVAAIGSYIVSDHYFPVDFRYLGIALFAGFVALASVLSRRTLNPKIVVITGIIILAGIIIALPTSVKTYRSEQQALNPVATYNKRIVSALKSYKVDVLVGNYWRVVPIRLLSNENQAILPLMDCTQPRDLLSSKNWQKDLKESSFAYILSLESPLADAPSCGLDTITEVYGRPSKSVVINGTVDKPKELLLLYNNGITNGPHVGQDAATIKPILLSDFNDAFCSASTTLQVVAHQDDDLLFMNPATFDDIKSGHCVRTIYLTAGDAGADQFYWLRREEGAIAAYSTMLGVSPRSWSTHIIKLGDQQFIRAATSKDNPNVSLIFMRLPDGNVNGQGFKSSEQQSLAKLDRGVISTVKSVDKQSVYSLDDLTNALGRLMQFYSPSIVRLQSTDKNATPPDHSDHLESGKIATTAFEKYKSEYGETAAQFYVGYPVASKPENVIDQTLTDKSTIFRSYSAFDSSVCAKSTPECQFAPIYQTYLRRSYSN
ncbi:MAG TPA: PIG-L family deacetylase [Candidatus Saccharimonadales bacterium]|nr:PIG-L family deacetylase [Candidatus Saccharimonadales bacterium]